VHDLEPAELRVLGALIEKQRTTPDAYPLTLNGLRAACNQTTNRDPVAHYDDATIRDALHRLGRRRWTRLAGAGRAPKYRHLLDEALGLSARELSLLAVLMLRGTQTPGELKQRAGRLHAFTDLAAVHETLEKLVERGYVERLPRRPGQKEERFAHLLGGEGTAEPAAGLSSVEAAGTDAPAPSAAEPSPPSSDAPGDRLARLERELAELRGQVRELRDALGG
jgi:uncharacterized protein YceH (UPF0502 family)